MKWIPVLFGAATVILFMRSMSLLRGSKPPGIRCFGWVTLIVTALAAVLFALMAQGMLVISPELGLAMVQGGAAARCGLDAVLLATALLGGLGWHAARLRANRADRRNVLVAAGAVVGIMATWLTRPLNLDDGGSLRIYSYDLWWPLLPLWLAACLVATGFGEPLLSCRPFRGLAITLAIAAITVVALLRPEFAEPTSTDLWTLTGFVALPTAWAIAGWLAVPRPAQGRSPVRIATKAIVSFLGAILGFWVIALVIGAGRHGLVAWIGGLGQMLLVLAWPLLLGLVRLPRTYSLLRVELPSISGREWGVVASVGLIALTIVQLFYVAAFAPAVVLTAFLVAWIALSELLDPGSLSVFCKGVVTENLLAKDSWLRVKFGRAVSAVASIRAIAAAKLAAVFKAETYAVLILKVAGAVLLLVVLAAVPDAGKIVVLPPMTPDGPDYKGVGQAVADHVANSIAMLDADLLPDLIVLKALRQGGELGGRATSHGSGTLDAALAKSSDLKLWDVTIPLTAVVAPIQRPVQALIGVRVVSGSLHENQDGYTLLAESSTGQNWRIDRTWSQLIRAADDGPPPPAPLTTSNDDAGAGKTDAAKSTPITVQRRVKPAEAVPLLADELAFGISREDPKLAALGMTRSWEAFQSFRQGLRSWRRFEVTRRFDELGKALDGFRNAIRIDPAFTLAHYRLALALQKDGQPGQAVEALRESLRASPNFLPAVSALATTLWDFESFYFPPPAASSRKPTEPEVERARRVEARKLWERLVEASTEKVAPTDLAAANYGLCVEAFSARTLAAQTKSDLAQVRRDMSTLVGKLDEVRVALARLVPAEEASKGADGVRFQRTPSESLERKARATLGEVERNLTAARDLLAQAGLEGAGRTAALDKTLDRVEDARESLAELVHAGRGWVRRRDQVRVGELRDRTANAFSQLHVAMYDLVTGELGNGLAQAVQVYEERAEHQTHITYFYCKRGAQLYDLLPKDRREAPEVRRAEGLVLNMLGILLEDAGSARSEEKAGWHCRRDDYLSPEQTKSDASSALYRSGPYASVAQRYYQRASGLLPDDWAVRCNAARVARAMGDERPMYELSTSAGARMGLGMEFLDNGQNLQDARYLKRAIDEFREAIRRDPYQIESLNGFAYSAWQWRWFEAAGGGDAAPDPEVLSEAEGYARTAVALTTGRPGPARLAQVRSTLGEIVLAQGRGHEAAEELRRALQDYRAAVGVGADHASFHELRWDLAQADLCAAAVDEGTGFKAHAMQLRAEAASLLDEVMGDERRREVAFFSDGSRAPDSLSTPMFCGRDASSGGPEGGRTDFRLTRATHRTAPHLVCGRQWVRAIVHGNPDVTGGLMLTLWGGGLQLSVGVSQAGATDEVAIAGSRADTHHVYFAQLTQWGEPRSIIQPLRTFAVRPGANCSRNLLLLEFSESRSEARQPK